jgi:hypothetical protein
MIDELARNAAANGVTIYALEPELPLSLFVKTAASRPVGDTRSSMHVTGAEIIPQQMLYETLHYGGQTLTSLTEKTGGKWFRGTGTIDDVFRQVASDMTVYYSLAYRATSTRDQPRRIEVRIRNRPDLRARTRTDVIDKSPEREMADLVVANLLFPRALNELNVRVTATTPARSGRRFDIPIDVAIPLEKLTFVQIDGDKYAATLDIHYAAAGQQNDFTTTGRHQQTIEITAAQHATRAGTTYRFKTSIQAPAGQTKIAIGVMDRVSRLAGFQNVDAIAR